MVGDASAIEAGVEVRGGADAPFVLLEAVEPVAVGDGVRTDVTGFAEIAYLDGSRTLLDIDTEFEVVELTDDAGVSTTRTSMGVGRTWHRVESLGEGEFTVETSQATATVRGTAFVLDCVSAGNCSYVCSRASSRWRSATGLGGRGDRAGRGRVRRGSRRSR